MARNGRDFVGRSNRFCDELGAEVAAEREGGGKDEPKL